MDIYYCGMCCGRGLHKKTKHGVPMKKFTRWTEKFHDCKKIGEEPAMNREGFWKKKEYKELKIERADQKKR